MPRRGGLLLAGLYGADGHQPRRREAGARVAGSSELERERGPGEVLGAHAAAVMRIVELAQPSRATVAVIARASVAACSS